MVIFHSKDTKLSNISDTVFWGSLRHYAPGRGAWNRFGRVIVFRFKRSPPFQRRVWVDCLYRCGESAQETTKKRQPRRLSVVFRSSQSPPFQRRVWVDCLYKRGIFPRQNKKRQLKRCRSLFWSGKRDSNSRPQPWQGCALPTELFPQNMYHPTLQSLLAKVGCVYPFGARLCSTN